MNALWFAFAAVVQLSVASSKTIAPLPGYTVNVTNLYFDSHANAYVAVHRKIINPGPFESEDVYHMQKSIAQKLPTTSVANFTYVFNYTVNSNDDLYASYQIYRHVWKSDTNKLVSYGPPYGPNATHIFTDTDENAYVISKNGLHINHRNNTVFRNITNLDTGDIRHISADSSSKDLYVIKSNNVYVLPAEEKKKHNPRAEILYGIRRASAHDKFEHINLIKAGQNGEIYFGVQNLSGNAGALNRLQDGEIQTLIKQPVESVAVIGEEEVYASSVLPGGGCAVHFINSTNVSVVGGLKNIEVCIEHVIADSEGNVFFGTGDNDLGSRVYVLKTGKASAKRIKIPETLKIYSLTVDAQDNVLILTEADLYVIEKGTVTAFAVPGLPYGPKQAYPEVRVEKPWILANGTIYVVSD